MKRWSLEEIEYLRQFSHLQDSELGQALGRTKASVQYARRYHNIPGLKRKPIEQREIDFVLRNTPNMTDAEMGQYLGRSREMVSHIRCKTEQRKYRRFSTEELEWLISNFPQIGMKACAEQLHRPRNSIRQKIYELRKIHPDLYWEPILELSQTDLAYLAGIIDGEGSIHVGIGWKKGRPSIGCALNITNTSEKLKDWLELRLNGPRFSTSLGTNLLCFRCFVRPPYLQKLLEVILPFLIIKEKQAELMLRYLRSREKHRREPVSENEMLLVREIRRLNFHHKVGSKTYLQYQAQEARIAHYLESLEE